VRRLARLAAVVLVAFAAGCSSSSPSEKEKDKGVETTSKDDLDRLQERVAAQPADLAARFELACELERKGLLEGAKVHYAVVAQELPPGKFTRPWLCFGRVELALGHDVSGRRALEKVLAIVPEQRAYYADNDDYQEAALLLAPILRDEHAYAELARLKARYLVEFEGDPERWPGDEARATRSP
jgi:hypothetical protein